MKKEDRIARGESRKSQFLTYREQELAMQDFIFSCKDAMTGEEWETYFSEAERSAGETFHIVQYLMFALGKCQTTVTPALRRSIEAVMTELDIDHSEWPEFQTLNFDEYWREHYGIKEG